MPAHPAHDLHGPRRERPDLGLRRPPNLAHQPGRIARQLAGATRPLVMRVEGDGFLRHMVRNIVGTVVEIGAGRWPPPRMAEILASRDRREAGRAAPPCGLFLTAVRYPEP